METKTCKGCGLVKPLEDFWWSLRSQDGRAGKCKNCDRKHGPGRRHKVTRHTTPTHLPEGDPWANFCAVAKRASPRIYARKTPWTKEWAKQHARQKLNQAARAGEIIPPESCMGCGRHFSKCRRTAHHLSYDPFDVEWLCPKCHAARHSVWTRAKALAWYGEVRAQLGHRVRQEDMGPYIRSFRRLFGSVARFQAAAGDEPGQPGRPRKGVLGEVGRSQVEAR